MTARGPGPRWLPAVLLLLLLPALARRGGLAGLGVMLRFGLPILGLLWVWRWLGNALGSPPRRRQQPEGGPADAGPIIDLCPRCGRYLGPRHRCQP